MPKTTSEEISVIIVSYNSNDTIYKLLTSLKLIDTCISEIIIIDNNSVFFYKDKIKNLSVKIKIIENKKNIGFAKAVNQGIRICKSKYVLLLNPDTYLIDRSIINSFRIIKANCKSSVFILFY